MSQSALELETRLGAISPPVAGKCRKKRCREKGQSYTRRSIFYYLRVETTSAIGFEQKKVADRSATRSTTWSQNWNLVVTVQNNKKRLPSRQRRTPAGRRAPRATRTRPNTPQRRSCCHLRRRRKCRVDACHGRSSSCFSNIIDKDTDLPAINEYSLKLRPLKQTRQPVVKPAYRYVMMHRKQRKEAN